MLMRLVQANFAESQEKIVRLLRAVWMRKRVERQRREWEAHLARLRRRLGDDMH